MRWRGRAARPVPPDPGLVDLAGDGRLRRLELAVTRRLDGLLHGRYQGLLPGPGSEPAGSREYRPGEDEVRRMDWAVTARTTVPHVRQLDADRELTTWLLVDASISMEYGTAELDKRELAVAAVAAVGFLTVGVGNRLGAQVLTPTALRRYPPGSGRTHLFGLLRMLLAAPSARRVRRGHRAARVARPGHGAGRRAPNSHPSRARRGDLGLLGRPAGRTRKGCALGTDPAADRGPSPGARRGGDRPA